jgi:hypothetical protein
MPTNPKHALYGRGPGQRRAHGPRSHNSHQTIGRGTPRVSLRFARGHNAPSGEATLGPRHCTYSPTRELNALARHGRSGQRRILATPALGIISRGCSTNPPCAAIPGTVRELCGKANVSSVTLCRPLMYRHRIAPLERGWRNPRKGYVRLPRARSGQRRDVGLVECVTSVTSRPVRPSPPLCHHPRHCSAIPDTVEARGDETPPRPLLCILRPSVSRALESVYGQ